MFLECSALHFPILTFSLFLGKQGLHSRKSVSLQCGFLPFARLYHTEGEAALSRTCKRHLSGAE